jgi:hypothetical protein
MKSLTVIAIVFFVSCSNPKVRIVEQQKKVRDSIVMLKDEYAVKMLSRSIKMKDSFNVAYPDWERLGLLNEAIKMDTLGYKLTNEMRTLSDSIRQFRNQYDSLELELKKY